MRQNLLQKIIAVSLTLLLISIEQKIIAQKINPGFKINTSALKGAGFFIDNAGQYGNTVKGYEVMGKVLMGYEGFGMPVLFTSKGMIHLHRSIDKISKAEEQKLELEGVDEEEIETKRIITDRIITMEWLGANSNVQIVKSNKKTSYSTYGLQLNKAYGYEEIIYKNLYNGIDVIYNFSGSDGENFKYSIIAEPGADISRIKLKYGGDVKTIKQNNNGEIVINSSVNGITESAPVSFYTATKKKIDFKYSINNNIVTFKTNDTIDVTKKIIIDPFIGITNNLNGINAGKAKDIDFDYAGNIYVTGGGDGNTTRMAKYNNAGVLQWTFNGSITTPSWAYGANYGGAVVEKASGEIYVGQGIIVNGFKVIKLNTAGVYANFITIANPNFRENWKMFWNCNNGVPEILIAGGGVTSNINLGKFTPPSTAVSSLNITGNSSMGQDIVDFAFDPETNNLYSVFASNVLDPLIDNKIFKNNAPYSAASVAWNVSTGYTTLREYLNRPYLIANDNSANILSLNGSYLYFWDGKNLKAFSKPTGATVGTPLITANMPKEQGGIFADGCNNIFVGSVNGTVKVYNFNGAIFNDAPPDIAITGFETKSVYDVLYDESRKLLYVCGNGFVASVDVSSYCTLSNIFTLNLLPNCNTLSVTSTLTPALPSGSVATYVLNNGTTALATNTTGIFTGLAVGINYNVTATVNAACSGTQISSNFQFPTPTFTSTVLNVTCASNNGQITAVGSGSIAPYTYSIDGITFNTSGVFSGLTIGTYNITVKDANGCTKTSAVTVSGNTAGAYSYTISNTNTTCGNTNGTITIVTTGGALPFQFSVDNGATFQNSNTFINLQGALYQIKVKDATGCLSNTEPATILSSTQPTVSAVSLGSSCGPPVGIITATGSGGQSPYVYSINGGISYQSSNIFNNVVGGNYSVTIKDIKNCTNISPLISLVNISEPGVTATTLPSTCSLANGSIIATGLAGQPPFTYSIDGGIVYQNNNSFNNLLAGNYIITVKDANGCTKSTSNITVPNAAAPVIRLIATDASCGFDNGKINAVLTGGTAGFQYSLNNGLTFQNNSTFNNLPPNSYSVLVKDANNCTALGTVLLTRIPIANYRVFVGKDTTISINEPLQLNAADLDNAGFSSFVWSPIGGLSRPDIKSPTAVLDKDITYYLIATTLEGCSAKDTINIKINYNSEIFVPNAFTPNNDSYNDILKPKLIGIRGLKYFSVYNRYGQLVYKTTTTNTGWDGRVKGTPQNTDTFVWIVEAVDFKGRVLFKKGTTILIR